jgi:hypothetical protein
VALCEVNLAPVDHELRKHLALGAERVRIVLKV